MTSINDDSVSNEKLLEDIRLTELELSAYVKLYQGFKILSKLPENKGFYASKYNMEYQKYLNGANECNEFLVELKKLKLYRGL
jgi:hypothetical protein